MKQRRTPSGHVVIERPEGLYLIGPIEDALRLAHNERFIDYERTEDGVHRFEFRDSEEDESGAEWGSSIFSADEALRFALGAFLGSHEDPEITGEDLP